MQKIIGKYKKDDIFISELHLRNTYANILLGRISLNNKIIYEKILEYSKKHFGEDVSVHIAGKSKLNLKKDLPETIVYAYLNTNSIYQGNHLVLAWFQESNADSLEEAKKHLEEVDWEQESCEFSFW